MSLAPASLPDPLPQASSQSERKRLNLSFVAWGWAMIAVILLSAAPTSAQPRSRLVGSAFDPATTSVVISPKRIRSEDQLHQAVPTPPPEEIEPQVGVIDTLLHRDVLSVCRTGGRCDHAPPPRSTSAPPLGAHRPRAPPAS